MAFTFEMLGWGFLNPQEHGQLILSLIWISGIGGTVYVGVFQEDRSEGFGGFGQLAAQELNH
jgi:hypothetical protein